MYFQKEVCGYLGIVVGRSNGGNVFEILGQYIVVLVGGFINLRKDILLGK